jgi:hypothetical protein
MGGGLVWWCVGRGRGEMQSSLPVRHHLRWFCGLDGRLSFVGSEDGVLDGLTERVCDGGALVSSKTVR